MVFKIENFFSDVDVDIPLAIFPVISFNDQMRVIQESIDYLINNKTDSQHLTFIKLIDMLVKERYEKVWGFTSSYWKIEQIGIYKSPNKLKKIFYEKNCSFLKFIKNELAFGNLSIFIIIYQRTSLIFKLSPDNVLYWSSIVEGIQPLFLACITLYPSLLLENINIETKRELNKSNNRIIRNLSSIIKKIHSINTQSQFKQPETNYFFIRDFIHFRDPIFQIINDFYLAFTKKVNNVDITVFLNELRKLDYDIKYELNERYQSVFKNENLDLYTLLGIHPLEILEFFPLLDENKNLKSLGRFYTPISLVKVIVKETIYSFYRSNPKKLIFDTKIFDPAMGTGIILIYTLEYLANLVLSDSTQREELNFIEIRQKILQNSIFGNDIDRKAVNFAYYYFMLFCEFQGFTSKSLDNFTNKNFLGEFLESIEKNSFTTIKKFDIILSNPPFIPLHSRFTKNVVKKEYLTRLKAIIPEFCGNRINLYIIFLGICLNTSLSSEFSLIAFIIDRSFLDLPSYAKIRNHILMNYHLIYVLSDYKYNSATVDLSILIISKMKRDRKYKTIWQKNFITKKEVLTLTDFRSQPYNAFLYKDGFELIKKIKENSVELGSICKISSGLEYGSLLKSNFLSDKAKENFFPVIDGSNNLPHSFIIYWVPGCSNSFVRFDKKYEEFLMDTKKNISASKKKVLLISGDIKRFLNPKIIIRQSSKKFIASYDESKYLALRNIHLIYDVAPPYSLYFILGILNSSLGTLMGEKLNIIRKTEAKRYPQIRINDLKLLLIRDCSKLTKNQLLNKIEIEEVVKESLNLASSISEILVKIWNIIQSNNEQNKFKMTQRSFLKLYLTDSRSIAKLSAKSSLTIAKEQKKVKYLFNKLKHRKEKLDNLIFRFYGINEDNSI